MGLTQMQRAIERVRALAVSWVAVSWVAVSWVAVSWVVVTWAVTGLLFVSLTGCGVSSVNDVSAGLADNKAMTGLSTEQPAPKASAAINNAAARKEAEKAVAVANPKSTAYKIGPEDVIDVTVFKVAELSKTVQVNESGAVNLPLVGELPAVGRTTREVEQDLTKALGGKYLRNPQVNVSVKEYNSQRVTVEGDIKKPGIYPFRGRMTLLQIVATTGGFEATADTEVIVFRAGADSKQTAAKFDVEQIRAGTAKDPELASGDVIIVSSSATKVAFQNLLKALPLASIFLTVL